MSILSLINELLGAIMKKISIIKVQKLKTTAIALYPIYECWPFPF